MPAIPLFFWSPWHLYTWANYGPRYAPSQFGIIQVQNITPTTAQIALMPNIGGQWKVAYGTKTGEYGQVTPWIKATQGIGSAVVLQGLNPQTEYFFNVVVDGYASNPAGLPISGCFYTDEQNFSTIAVPPPPGPVISGITSEPGNPTAAKCTILWTTDQPSDSTVTWQLNGPPTTGSPSENAPALVTSHSMVIPATGSLTGPGASYEYTVTSKLASGGTTTSPVESFST
jgi:hypothetical protein